MNQRQSGFTLLEVLVAVSFMTIAFLALAYVSIGSTRLSATAAQVPEARAILASELSKLQQRGYQNLNQCNIPPNSCTGETSATDGFHRTAWRIERDTALNGYVRVNLTTIWTKAGVTRRFSTAQLVTCLEDPGGTASNPYPGCPL
ncbi:type II secretion system protein [Deinococcus peraridilitoris]|uniref:Prepilin-type N-terminal cleavage/methylation domain-containing protein n=1 Tax=Deinococcus peraridilitoris (strain DSM 19664 / LMG 22246 / CIP 109416 / KR-200) TaxID=937777 RepID=L0A1Z8_DEIPD|nr:type II secretion system protein [Deinococcus peraridilitoris]AFZ67474.1 prepilin-type N-terminal cleavage/methylation domain-containing protein [Deinococcus peraridilitoris DSM 19664]